MKRLLFIIVLVGAFFIAIYSALVYYDDYFPYGRMWETPAIKPHETHILKMEADLSPFTGGDARLRETKGEGLVSPLDGKSAGVLAMGNNAYIKYCAFCHGKNHDGMGTVGQSFYPLPTDLKSPQVKEKSDGALFYTISFGSKRSPGLATTMAADDRWAVVHYIRSLKTDSAAVSDLSSPNKPSPAG